jgi:PAS domain S-box-containing protein
MYLRQSIFTLMTTVCFAVIGLAQNVVSTNHYIDSLQNILKSSSDSSRVDILNKIAYNFYYFNLDSTDDYALKAMALADSLHYLKGLSEAQRMMGISAKAQNNEKEAFRWMYEGLETARSINYYQGIADNLNSIGVFFSYVEDHERAISYFKRSIENQIIAKNKLREGILYTNIGSVYLKKEDFDSAAYFYEKSKAIIDSVGDERWQAMVYSQYGGLLLKIGDLKMADALSRLALKLSKQNGQSFHLRKSYQNLAEISLAKKDYDTAATEAHQALRISEEIGFLPYLIEAYDVLYQINKAQNKTREALHYHEMSTQVKDSLRTDQLNSEADMISFQLELEKKETENRQLRMENRSQEAENQARKDLIQRQTIFGIGTSIVLVIVSFLAFVLFRLRQKERTTNKKLVLSNQELAEQKEELTATLQMVEHLNAQLQAQNNALNQSAIVSITDLEGNIISVNSNFCKVSGYEMDELIGENKRILNSGEHDVVTFANLWSTIKDGGNWRGELKNKKKNGEFFWVDTAIAPVVDDNGNPKKSFSLQFEITERKKYLNQLSAKNHELEDLNKPKEKLLPIVPHDIRGPLNSLQGTLSLLLQGALTQDEFKMLTHDLVEKLDHTYNLLENLLNWAKSQMQGMKVYPKLVNVQAIANDCINLLAPIAKKKMAIIENKIQQVAKDYENNEMVKLILRNLLSNAIKFSHSRSTIVLDLKKDEEQVIVSVRDHGLGISNENQDKLFKYENFSTYGTSNEKGMGLGLLLCKDFIERNGGKIWFESELEKGSTFYFTLPTKVLASAQIQS